MKFEVDYLMYGYLIVCAFVVLYNIFTIFYSAYLKNWRILLSQNMKNEVRRVCAIQDEDEETLRRHINLVKKKTRKTNGLLAYARALDELAEEEGVETTRYDAHVSEAYRDIAVSYASRDAMDRAFAAFFISTHPAAFRENANSVCEILLSYLERSTVYCRENVLKALYAIGNVQALLKAFLIMEEQRFFHHRKLVADGLMSFAGHKGILARELWDRRHQFSEEMRIALIRFMTMLPDDFSEEMLRELKSGITSEERLAILRYFRKHVSEPAAEYMYALMRNETDVNETIVIAGVLAAYPGKRTMQTLKRALCHSNWHVRKNAAASLVQLGLHKKQIKAILGGSDAYAADMLRYTMQSAQAGRKQDTRMLPQRHAALPENDRRICVRPEAVEAGA